jgi:hypothetical protein
MNQYIYIKKNFNGPTKRFLLESRPIKLYCLSCKQGCGSAPLLCESGNRFLLFADPDPAFHLDANLDPDPDPAFHEGYANLRPIAYRPSRAPF